MGSVTVTKRLAEFAINTQYDSLPKKVVHESKRLLLDSIAVAFAGLNTEKGKLSLALTKKIGGHAESTIIATGDRGPSALVAFANGELMDAMEYSALINPMGPAAPFIIPAPLAVSESVRASGKELIVAIAVSAEVSTRIAAGLKSGRRFNWEIPGKNMAMAFPVPGHGLHIFGGTLGCGRLLGLNEEKMCNAIGIAGYMCPVPMLMKFATTTPSAMTKHLPAGWISQAEVTSALLALTGYSGDKEILDGEYGFWRSFGADGWTPNVVVDGLAEKWYWYNSVYYKPYPCCAAMHNALNLFYQIVDKNKLKPCDIEQVTVRLSTVAQLPLWSNKQIQSNTDTQFSTAYVFAAAAYSIGIQEWQRSSTFKDPKILDFMKRVKVETYGVDYALPVIEVVAVKDGLRQVYSRGNAFSGTNAISDEHLAEKFKNNAYQVITPQDGDKLVTTIFKLEEVLDVSELLKMN